MGVDVEVMVPDRAAGDYLIDDIPVTLAPAGVLADRLAGGNYSAVMIHLLHHSLIGELDGGRVYSRILSEGLPCVFFVHGIEVQRVSTRRPEDIKLRRPKSMARAAYRDLWGFPRIRRTIKRLLDNSADTRFVCVSEWMLKDVESSLGFSISRKAVTIPNGIDTEQFSFDDRWPNRHRMLTIRPLVLRGKYAVDLAVDTMATIKNSPVELTLYGQGEEKQQVIDYIDERGVGDRISMKDQFLDHQEIPAVHACHGIYLAVTRMDAQGVSMCEAMASGLPVVSFDTCAIPEFIEHGVSGFLARDFDVEQVGQFVDELLASRDTFTRIAENARRSIEAIDIRVTAARELAQVNGPS